MTDDYDNPGYAHRRLATDNQVRKILSCDDTVSGNGRSDWYWLTMPNGDQMLACYPHGDLYLDICDEGVTDAQA